jgi:L-lactate dehydrogenase (cytochrome)
MWYQLYLAGEREISLEALARARTAGYTVLVVTIDTAVGGHRVRDLRNGLRELIGRDYLARLPYVWQILARPRWLAGFYGDGGLMSFPNVVLPGQGPMRYSDVAGALARSGVCWDDLAWIREAWDGPIVIKGIYTADDARRAVDRGAHGIVVSNHGGRQLDGVAAAIRTLPEIVAAVGDRTEVLFDSGVRRGSDIAKAICLGARAVLVGRAYMYGVAAGGTAGAARAIEILRDELERTLRLLGVGQVADLNPSFVRLPREWRDEE